LQQDVVNPAVRSTKNLGGLKMIKQRWILLIVITLMAISITGCSGSAAKNPGDSQDSKDSQDRKTVDVSEPADLTLYTYNLVLSDEEFQHVFTESLKKRFPNVTIKMLRGSVEGPTAPEFILSSGENPDLIMTGVSEIPVFTQLKLAADLNSFIKNSGYDLQRFEPSTMDTIKKFGTKGEIYGLPYSLNFAALFYNKSLFNKFGVDYPKEMITWDEVMELSRKLTRSDGGTSYYGFVPPPLSALGSQKSLPFVDPKSNKALLLNDQWTEVFKLFKQFTDIPGIVENGKAPNIRKSFIEQQSLAMVADWVNGILPRLVEAANKGDAMEWDITTYPSFKGDLGKNRSAVFSQLMVSTTSKHQELAFEIIKFMDSDEIQQWLSQNGRVTVLNNEAIKKQFGSANSSLKGKNFAAALKSKTVPIGTPTDYDSLVVNILKNSDDKLIAGNTDINTLLRETQASADQAIAEAKAK
jgi:multiple sugar transport system substrate-binding protein